MGHPALAHGHAAAARKHGYARRQPEQTVLYQAVAEHWPAFRDRLEELGGLPRFVVEEMDASPAAFWSTDACSLPAVPAATRSL